MQRERGGPIGYTAAFLRERHGSKNRRDMEKEKARIHTACAPTPWAPPRQPSVVGYTRSARYTPSPTQPTNISQARTISAIALVRLLGRQKSSASSFCRRLLRHEQLCYVCFFLCAHAFLLAFFFQSRLFAFPSLGFGGSQGRPHPALVPHMRRSRRYITVRQYGGGMDALDELSASPSLHSLPNRSNHAKSSRTRPPLGRVPYGC